MDKSLTAITNGVVFTGERLLGNKAVLLMGEAVLDIVDPAEIPERAIIIDASGGYVAPGFIDLQIYGGGTHLFATNPTNDAMREIAQALVKSGTTGFFITLATNTEDVVNRAMDVLRDYRHAALLGLHLEGPYLNPLRKGAHPAEHIRRPLKSELEMLLTRADGNLKMMTIAPERFNKECIAFLLEKGVLLSAGHSDASFDEATEGFELGIQAVTHLFNAMSPFHHRNTGLPGAVFQSSRARASVIADGIHVDYQTLSISKKLLGERLFLITDAVTETTTGVYTHVFKDDRYTLPDGTLSGSALTMMQAVANCVQHAGISLEEALRMASLYPALLIGRLDLGRIAPGARANLVIFDRQFTIKHVFLSGLQQ